MRFDLTIYQDVNANKTGIKLLSLSTKLKEHFALRSYGEDLRWLMIVVIAYDPSKPEHYPKKLLKPFYTDYKVKKNPYTNEMLIIEKYFQFSLIFSELEYLFLCHCTEMELEDLCLKKILASKEVFEKFRDKLEDFNIESFFNDIEFFNGEIKSSH